MADKSTIEWTDATWNPVTGCTQVSPGCANCYAKTFSERWRGIPGHHFEQGFDLKLWPERLLLPLKWREPRRIFVNSMSDLFHEDVPIDFIRRVFDVMGRANHHVFQVLTKRPDRMAELSMSDGLKWESHIWAGTSIENRRFVKRADALRRVPAPVRFISAEPLLGRLEGLDLAGISWLITGGESGPGHRPIDPAWVTELRDLSIECGVAFFHKQWGGIRPKAGGRLLDGQTWDQMPIPWPPATRELADTSISGPGVPKSAWTLSDTLQLVAS